MNVQLTRMTVLLKRIVQTAKAHILVSVLKALKGTEKRVKVRNEE